MNYFKTILMSVSLLSLIFTSACSNLTKGDVIYKKETRKGAIELTKTGSLYENNQKIMDIPNVSSIHESDWVDFALTSDGSVYALSDTYHIYKNHQKLNVSSIQSIVSHGGTHFGLSKDGSLYSWGYNGNGELGNGTSNSGMNADVYQVHVPSVQKIIPGKTTFVLTNDHKLYGWGSNGQYELGLGHTNDQYQPTRIPVSNVKSVQSDGRNGFALTMDGKLYAWGSNNFGEVGNGKKESQKTPLELKLPKVKSVFAEENVGMIVAITEDGSLYRWGSTWKLGAQPVLSPEKMKMTKSIIGNVKDIVYNEKIKVVLESGETIEMK